MKTNWMHGLSLVLVLAVCGACAPVPPKPEQLPGQERDPGKLEEATADIEERAGNKEAARRHRDRAIGRRYECNFYTFLIELIERDTLSLCAPPRAGTQTEPQRVL